VWLDSVWLEFCAVRFCVVRVLHKFDFRLLIDDRPNKWRSVDGRSCSDKESCRIYTIVQSNKTFYWVITIKR